MSLRDRRPELQALFLNSNEKRSGEKQVTWECTNGFPSILDILALQNLTGKFPPEGGPATRLMEHLHNTVRPNAQEGQKLRYRMARRHPPNACCFVLVRCGTEDQIRALEWHDIVNHRPSANGRHVSKKVRSHKRRKRPQKAKRIPCEVGSAFHSMEARCHIRKLERRMLLNRRCREKSLRNQPDDLAAPPAFHVAYLRCLRVFFALTGLLGPLNIYDLEHAPLSATPMLYGSALKLAGHVLFLGTLSLGL